LGLKDEKAPSVYLAEKDGDLSFLPYARDQRLLDLSRFDIDGLRDAPDSLRAFLFSDRGIYRPGDTAHIGLILRKRDWSALPSGLPLQAVITDPQDQEVWRQTIAFGEAGFEEMAWASSSAGKTGTYRVELFPWSGQVPGFPDYRFRGSLQARIPQAPAELGEASTDAQGVASFDLPLAAIDEPVFEITLAGEGFEKDSGRSVVNVTSALVSRHAFLLSQSPDGPLDYIHVSSEIFAQDPSATG
jgi:uncharacterized protein YfaS (alpha-2-macroglobulin family)